MKRKTRVIRFSILWFFAFIIIVGLIISFFKNYILAVNKDETKVVRYEANEKAIDLVQVMMINTDKNKKMINEERVVEYNTIYEENPSLPKDEQITKQEGVNGKVQVTAVQDYENNQYIGEEIIESKIIEEVIDKIIYVGTSEFLNKYQVHLNDNMYLLEAEELKENPNTDSTIICSIPRYLKVKLLETGDEWIKVSYNGNEGYIMTTNITSEAVNPIIKEKNRIATLQNNLNMEMDLSVPSGLTLSDYKTILSNNSNDKNKVFEQNAENFYNAEKKYKINGVFVIAIGIHESAWGTSTLAVEKKNLFGYKAYDRDPYNNASFFDGYDLSINTVTEALATKYLNISGTTISEEIKATGTYFNGTTLKDVNLRYASDEEWSEKVYKYMQYLYNRL